MQPSTPAYSPHDRAVVRGSDWTAQAQAGWANAERRLRI
jgi:hypothetical protein